MKFAVYMAVSFITFIHILLFLFFYHSIYGCTLCILLFCLRILILFILCSGFLFLYVVLCIVCV